LSWVLAALLAFLLAMLLAYLTRASSVRRLQVVGGQNTAPEARSASFNAHLNLLTGTHITGGNQVELLLNGDGTFGRLWEGLSGARCVICLHVYMTEPGEVADQLLRVLSERAQAGIEVYVLLDAVGAQKIGKNYVQRLRAAGAKVAHYRPLKFKTLYKFQQRMHMRAVIIDGKLGFTGGFGIADQWLGDGRHAGQWRDTNVRIEGPAAMQLQVAFSNNWAEATGDLLVGDAVTPYPQVPPPSEPQAAGIMRCTPSLGTTNAERFFFLAIASARERIYIANAYFVPTRDLRWLLMNAADRGVDVRVLTPGDNTDQCLTWYAARALYAGLIKAGIRIYEYTPAMMHAKTFVADGCWATVGTLNFDNRSTKLNDEVALVIRDDGFAAQLERTFMTDLEYAREVKASEARLRGGDAVRSRLARMATALL
jgi:cardiolipin synthase